MTLFSQSNSGMWSQNAWTWSPALLHPGGLVLGKGLTLNLTSSL